MKSTEVHAPVPPDEAKLPSYILLLLLLLLLRSYEVVKSHNPPSPSPLPPGQPPLRSVKARKTPLNPGSVNIVPLLLTLESSLFTCESVFGVVHLSHLVI